MYFFVSPFASPFVSLKKKRKIENKNGYLRLVKEK
jgi:hypothetical protein